jgi:hypothetical protein
MKIYLCGITQNQKEGIDGLTKDVYKHFDGLIFVDGGSTDGTKELLEERKGDGAILHRDWTNDHDFQMTEFLRQGPLEIGDWFITLDSMERLNPDFTLKLREFTGQLLFNKVRSVYNYGKGFMWEYFDDMYFLGSPHWGLQGARDKMIDISSIEGYEDPKTYSYNVRNESRQPEHFVDHFLKYYYVYPRSNHLLLGREQNRKEFEELEGNRQQFRFYCRKKLGLDFTVDSLKEYLSGESWHHDKKFIEMFNKETILKDFYRWHVLKHKLEDLEEKGGETWIFEKR